MNDVLQMIVVFGTIGAIILAPIYWRAQMRRRVLETVKELAASGSPMSPDLVVSLMGPMQPNRPSRQRDIRLGYVLIAMTVGIALVGVAAYIIAYNTGGTHEAPAIGAGVAAVGAIPGCIGVAFLLLGLGQKPE